MAEHMRQRNLEICITPPMQGITSIDSCKLAYYCLKLAVRDGGDKPNSTIRLSAAASLPTIPPWGHTTKGEYIFTTHREPKKSHQAKQSRILDGASPLVYRRLLSRV